MTITTIPRRVLRAFTLDEDGATAIEYGLLLALIAVACLGAFGAFGDSLGNMWGIVSDKSAEAMP